MGIIPVLVRDHCPGCGNPFPSSVPDHKLSGPDFSGRLFIAVIRVIPSRDTPFNGEARVGLCLLSLESSFFWCVRRDGFPRSLTLHGMVR
jgi:hypothetical protein